MADEKNGKLTTGPKAGPLKPSDGKFADGLDKLGPRTSDDSDSGPGLDFDGPSAKEGPLAQGEDWDGLDDDGGDFRYDGGPDEGPDDDPGEGPDGSLGAGGEQASP